MTIECKSNVQIFGFSYLSSSFWSSLYQTHPDYSVINILEYFWNIQELYPEVYLQFMDTWLFECKSNVQIFGFSYLSSSFWSSLYQTHPDYSVINILEYFWNIQELYPEVYLQFMDTWLFECKSNVQIFGFSYLSSSFYNSPYQTDIQIVQ